MRRHHVLTKHEVGVEDQAESVRAEAVRGLADEYVKLGLVVRAVSARSRGSRLEWGEVMKRHFTKIYCTAIVALTVGACASHTGVVSMGKDTYMISKQQATGFPGLGNMKAEIIAEGSQHCASLGKEFQIVATHETQPPYILGNYPRSEIQFMCLTTGDRELQRPRLQKSPDTVIEIRK